jgi:hypothetical protein
MSTENEAGLPVAGETASTVSEVVNQTELNTPDGTAPNGQVDEKQAEQAKTFTQAEVDALVQKRLLKEERKLARRFENEQREQQQLKALEKAPDRDSFRNDDDYVQAQIEHLAEKKALEKLTERESRRKQEEQTESFLAKAEKVTEKYPDFQTVVSNPNLAINAAMAEYISDSELGAEVAYFLGTNPMKAAQIAQMSPIKAARELTRIEAEIDAKPKPRISKAPEPINPVGSKGTSSSSINPSDTDDIATWMKKERDRLKRG